MQKTRRILILSLLALLAVVPVAFSQGGNVYEVTLTNLTANQIISPPILVSHSFRTRLFTPGRPASPELAAVAEDADASGLLAALASNPEVLDFAQADGVLMPGQSVTLVVRVAGRFRRLSAVGMLVTTNDAFFGLSNFRLDPQSDNFNLEVPAYDAGTEANTESCDDIPGPP
ncbi:MAG: spondin domain-containing protein, partial [Acidobacteria bacterium]|nr:spondin domain-containing protein [Acidobacteriota bacterium]